MPSNKKFLKATYNFECLAFKTSTLTLYIADKLLISFNLYVLSHHVTHNRNFHSIDYYTFNYWISQKNLTSQLQITNHLQLSKWIQRTREHLVTWRYKCARITEYRISTPPWEMTSPRGVASWLAAGGAGSDCMSTVLLLKKFTVYRPWRPRGWVEV